jgi:hypothetical protein
MERELLFMCPFEFTSCDYFNPFREAQMMDLNEKEQENLLVNE